MNKHTFIAHLNRLARLFPNGYSTLSQLKRQFKGSETNKFLDTLFGKYREIRHILATEEWQTRWESSDTGELLDYLHYLTELDAMEADHL